MDVTPYIQAKSDQLNADDLIAGPITVQIERVTQGSAEQPVTVRLAGGHMPWRPCKTSLRLLVAAWGADASRWAGRWVRLYRDPTVRFGSDAVGGIRISDLSHIDRPMTLMLAVSRGKKAAHKVGRLDTPEQQGAPTADLYALLEQHDITVEQVDGWRSARGKGPVGDLDDGERARFAAWLAADPSRLRSVRNEVSVGDPDPGEE